VKVVRLRSATMGVGVISINIRTGWKHREKSLCAECMFLKSSI
jgi:hypothetical protein